MFKDVTFFVVDNKRREIKSENVPKQIQNSFNKITKNLNLSTIKIGNKYGNFIVDDIKDNIIIFCYDKYEIYVQV